MKKIMFNDLYGLTQAVIDGRKTMTRRVIPESVIEDYQSWLDDVLSIGFDDIPVEVQSFAQAAILKARYSVGEIVAVAQAYKDIPKYNFLNTTAGWLNKMFVRADLMPIKIRITDVKVERLQDISDEDCLKEGIDYIGGYSDSYYFGFGFNNVKLGESPRKAFASLIDIVSGKGTWKANPWVFAYSFELVK